MKCEACGCETPMCASFKDRRPDPEPVIKAAREVRMIMMDGEYKSDFSCLRDLHAALRAYDAQREGE